MKKTIAVLLASVMALMIFAGCGKQKENVLRVYNWGEYIDEGLVEEFEEETGIRVIYDEFTTNEEMYPRIEADPSLYDVVCPSDYMVEKMMKNGLLQKVDLSKLKNKDNIGAQYYAALSDFVDPGNQYMVPYTWGTVGILYNTTLVDDPVNSWSILWDEKYAGSILMQDSVRDAFLVAEKLLGYSANTTDPSELAACSELLHEQYPLVKGYVIDEVRDKMIAGDTALAVIYSGEYMYCKEENPDLAYVIPDEGSNMWYDGWVITKGARNVDAAYQWLDFLLRADIAARNFEYITYPTPNLASYEYIDEELLNDPAIFPGEDVLKRCEVFKYLGEEAEDLYYEQWKKVK